MRRAIVRQLPWWFAPAPAAPAPPRMGNANSMSRLAIAVTPKRRLECLRKPVRSQSSRKRRVAEVARGEVFMGVVTTAS